MLPSELEKILDDRAIVYGQFEKEGTYTVSMKANLADCRDQMTKTITILKGEDEQEGGRLGYEPFVKSFTLHPNPSDGKFDVSIELLEESDIVLSVWSTVVSRMVGRFSDSGSRVYFKSIDIRPLPSGSYLLRLDHRKGESFIRFIVR